MLLAVASKLPEKIFLRTGRTMTGAAFIAPSLSKLTSLDGKRDPYEVPEVLRVINVDRYAV